MNIFQWAYKSKCHLQYKPWDRAVIFAEKFLYRKYLWKRKMCLPLFYCIKIITKFVTWWFLGSFWSLVLVARFNFSYIYFYRKTFCLIFQRYFFWSCGMVCIWYVMCAFIHRIGKLIPTRATIDAQVFKSRIRNISVYNHKNMCTIFRKYFSLNLLRHIGI